MMNDTHFFDKKRGFVEWAIDLTSRGVPANARIVIGYDLMSWSLKASIARESQTPAWATTVLRLPVTASQAREVWDAIQGENLCLFFFHEQYIGGILVAARNGAWKSLDDRYLPHGKGSFREISYEEAEKILNNKKIWTASMLRRRCSAWDVGCCMLPVLRHKLTKESERVCWSSGFWA